MIVPRIQRPWLLTVSHVLGSECRVDTLTIYNHTDMFRAKQLYLADMFEDEEEDKLREVPEEYNKTDYYARKTCNYITAVLGVREGFNKKNGDKTSF